MEAKKAALRAGGLARGVYPPPPVYRGRDRREARYQSVPPLSENIVKRKGEGRLLSPFLCFTLQLSKPIDNHISFDYNVLIR